MGQDPKIDFQTLDKVGLIQESYRIDGITEAECRSIFLDWALKLPDDVDPVEAIRAMLDRYGDAADHPMTSVLRAGLARPTQGPRRRGGARGQRKL